MRDDNFAEVCFNIETKVKSSRTGGVAWIPSRAPRWPKSKPGMANQSFRCSTVAIGEEGQIDRTCPLAPFDFIDGVSKDRGANARRNGLHRGY